MALGEQIKLGTLQKRGTSTCVNVSNKLRERLGWNLGDALRLDVVNGSLMITKVILNPLPALHNAVADTTVAKDVQSTSDNGE